MGFSKGHILSEETKEKMRQAKLKNPTRYWSGKKRPDMSMKFRKPKVKKNCATCNAEFFVIPALSLKRKFCSLKCRPSEFKKGQSKKENNINWRGGVTTENRKQRITFGREIQREILKRDNFTCNICNIRGGVLHVDHIKPWSEYPELRFEKDNCRTLCRECHYYVTFKRQLSTGNKWSIPRIKLIVGG